MSSSNFILAVLQHTPVWVWVLLVALLALGGSQVVERTVTLRRARVLPLSMLALSLWGVLSTFGSVPAWAAWAIGGLVSTVWSQGSRTPQGASWSAANQTFRLPGSWIPLALILGIFGTKFGVGVSLALHPELRQTAGFVLGTSLAYGVFSGIFAGRALVLWRLAHPVQALRTA